MTGFSPTIECPKCSAINDLRGKAMTLALTCKSCKTYFCVGSWNKDWFKFKYVESPVLLIGSRGKIDGHVYEVMGFVVKAETKYRYRWREYLLFNPYRGFAFLSEYNGNWNFVWPIEKDPRKKSKETFYYNNTEFQLYQRYSAEIIYASGEFFFDVIETTESTVNYEYVSAPHMIAIETNEDSFIVFQGEYLSPKEVATAFAISKDSLPKKEGIGYTQPFSYSINENTLLWVTVSFILVLVFVHFFLYNSADDKIVFQATYYQSQLNNQKMFATSSFDLNNGTKSLEVSIHAPLTNDWFFGDFSLIREDDDTEYNFTHEVEYYSGYEDGEAWSEGSTSGYAFLSQIPAGKYHLNIYPEFSATNREFSVVIRRDVPITSNFFITCIGILLFPLIFFIMRRYHEQQRWSDSDYSPYGINE